MTWLRAAPALAVLVGVSSALAADHLDGPAVKTDASTDITDLYTFMDGTSVAFVLNVNPLATLSAKFSTTAQYVIHTTSTDKFIGGATPKPVDIIATFDATGKIQLWVGTSEYVTGDPTQPDGLSSFDGKVLVFANVRDDPFFFNLDGFQAAQATVEAATGLTTDAAGCPKLDTATQMLLAKQLSTDPTGEGGPAKDFFAGKNVLSIILQIDKSLLTAGGPLVAAWASTNKAM
jgi:hypothetical protein